MNKNNPQDTKSLIIISIFGFAWYEIKPISKKRQTRYDDKKLNFNPMVALKKRTTIITKDNKIKEKRDNCPNL